MTKYDQNDPVLQGQVAEAAFRDAVWDALYSYRETGELAPYSEDGVVKFATVDEAHRQYPDFERRQLEAARRRADNLLEQFRMTGQTPTPDVWKRLEADARARYEDDLAYIREARHAAAREFSTN